MKKAVLFGFLLLATVLVWAGQQITGEKSIEAEMQVGTSVVSQPSVEPVALTEELVSPEFSLDDEIAFVSAQIADLKAQGLEPTAELFNRLAELEEESRPTPGSPLDQGGETCDAATVIPASEDVNYCVSGTMGATRDCVPPVDFAYRDLFYAFTPTVTGTYIISMCNSVADVVLNIYANTCCTADTFGNADDECGSTSDPVGSWVFTAGTTYYFQIGYYSSTQAAAAYNFTLIGPVDTTPPANDFCVNAEGVAVPSTTAGTLVGSADETTVSCGPTSAGYGAVWYTVVGNGDSLRARVPAPACYFFSPRVRVFRGACTELACVGGSGTGTAGAAVTFTWCSVPDVTYYVVISSYSSTARSRGPFTLEIIDVETPCTAPAWPENDYCYAAPTVAVPSQTMGTLVNATQDLIPSCNSISGSYSGVWYKVIGNDNLLTATTCNDQTGFDTRLSVYTGTCGSYTCVTANNNDAACTTGPGTPGNKSTVVWCSDLGVEYFLLVHNNSSTGNSAFRLDVLDGAPCHIDCETYFACGTPTETEPNDACADAVNFATLDCGSTVYGTICPQADVDYFHIAPANLGDILIIRLYEGENCDVYPPVGLRMRGATNADGTCGPATGTAVTNYILGSSCAPFTGGYIGVVRNTGFEAKYQVALTCSSATPACPNEVVPNQHCSGPCVGWAYDYGPGPVTTTFPLYVPLEYHITDLNVRFNMTHSFDADVDMFLITPWLDSLELTSDNGSSGDNFINTVFDDEGVNGLITAGTAPFTGSYIPEELLAGADGFNALGTWVLSITDDANSDSGYVVCWCLEFNYDYFLAVELNGFDAIPGDGQVELTWSTASESNNDRFEIVRNGATVAQVDATNQPTGDSYSWMDRNVVNGTPYTYTLVSVDMNGNRDELVTESATPGAGAAVITEYALHQNYPNPFNPQTSITFDLVESGVVSLKIFNLMGQEVAAVVNRNMDAGRHVVAFDAGNLPSGLYLYKLEANGFSDQKKMLLLK